MYLLSNTPIQKRNSPIFTSQYFTLVLLLYQINELKMKNKDFRYSGSKGHSRVSIGLFFIFLGLALLIATNDVLNLGSVKSYFTWETAMIFIGIALLLNRNFTGGILLIAGGIWFLQDEFFIFTPQFFKLFFWPSVIVFIGITFIVSSLFKK